VLNVPVPEIILYEPRVRALVGQGEAASVAQHVRMGKQGREAAALYFAEPGSPWIGVTASAAHVGCSNLRRRDQAAFHSLTHCLT